MFLSFIITAVVIGLVLWLLLQYVPMPSPIKTVIIVVVAIGLLLWGLRAVTGSSPGVNLSQGATYGRVV